MLEKPTRTRMFKQLPTTVVATAFLIVVPSLIVWALHGSVVSLPAVWSIAVASGLSLLLCHLGAQLWAKRRGADERLFADLMLWAWVRRWMLERRVDNAISVLGLDPSREDESKDLSPPERLRLLRQLASDLEARDPYVRGHSRRVARYASLIGSRMRLPRAEIECIRTAAALHDIGKLHTPVDVLHKPGPLSKEEFKVVQRHAAVGARIIQVLGEDAKLAAIVRHHHERLDGTGYPGGLTTDEIPLGSRIIAVADTFDAITANRPYRRARPHRVALDIMGAEAGTQLDPDVVAAFTRVYRGERPLGVFVAFSNGVVRLLSEIASTVTLPAAGIAAATALGTGFGPVDHGSAAQKLALHRAAPVHVASFGSTRAFPTVTVGSNRGSHPAAGKRTPSARRHQAGSRPAANPAGPGGVSPTPGGVVPVATSAAPSTSIAVNVPVAGTGTGVAVATASNSSGATTSLDVRASQTLKASARVGIPNEPGASPSVALSAGHGLSIAVGGK